MADEPSVDAELAHARSFFEQGDLTRSASILSRLLETAPDAIALDLVEAEVRVQRERLAERTATAGAAEREQFDQTPELLRAVMEPAWAARKGTPTHLVVVGMWTALTLFSLSLVFFVGLPIAETDDRSAGITVIVVFGIVAVVAARSLTRSVNHEP